MGPCKSRQLIKDTGFLSLTVCSDELSSDNDSDVDDSRVGSDVDDLVVDDSDIDDSDVDDSDINDSDIDDSDVDDSDIDDSDINDSDDDMENTRQLPRSYRMQKPILVVCYTNHALDQFLEGILAFCRKGRFTSFKLKLKDDETRKG